MKYMAWDPAKNEWLKATRGVGFEEVMDAVVEGRVLAVLGHKNFERHPNQRIIVVNIHDYAYIVPFVEDDEKVFLKTVYPSRKHTKRYIEKGGS